MNKFRNKFIDLVFDMINPTEQEGFLRSVSMFKGLKANLRFVEPPWHLLRICGCSNPS